MLVDGQIQEIKWNTRTKEWYINKGYVFTKLKDAFHVKVEDLSPGARYKVKVKCDYCGQIIDVVWRDYLKYSEKNTKYACCRCRQRKTSDNNLKERQEKIYSRALEFCESRGYKLITPIDEIKTVYSMATYECPKHGLCETKIILLAYGHGCLKCGYEISSQKTKLDVDYIEKYFSDHGSHLLNKDEYVHWNSKNLKATCPQCGEIFVTSFNSFKIHDGQRCPKCSQLISKGEKKVKDVLEHNCINYEFQKRFNDCRTSIPLPFDFYLPDYNLIIEYDGEGHYIPINHGGMNDEVTKENLKDIQKRDNIKNKYCFDNNIELLRIPYWDFDNIEYILSEKLNLHEDIV